MRELQKAAQTAQTTDSPDRIDFYFRKEWRVLALITVSGLIYNLGLLAGPWFERRMTGCLIQILNGSSTAAQMLTLVCAYILSIAVVQGSRYIKRFYAWRFANNVNRKNRRAVSRTSGCVPETLHNIRTIHVLGKEPYMENRYDQYIRDSYRAMEKTNFYDAVYSPVILIFNAVVVAVVMLLSASGNPKVLTLFGYVEQSFHQVPGTVKDQITLFNPDISMEAVKRAAVLTGLDETIMQMEHGYDTVCTPELFSQGQWQLLSIARAAAAEPELFLLDEITANLDAETEQAVLKALKQVSEDRTVISISHRIAAEFGRIIQVGS